MPRKRKITARQVLPDPKYDSALVSTFINSLMRQGKRSVGERVLYDALDIVQEQTGQDALGAFQKAVENVKPVIQVRPRRVGGQTYQIPVEVPPERRTTLSIRWIIDYAKARSGKSMAEKLAGELVDASRNEGGAIRRREDTHRMAEANRAFAHYRW